MAHDVLLWQGKTRGPRKEEGLRKTGVYSILFSHENPLLQKKILLLFFALFLSAVLFSQEQLFFVATKDTSTDFFDESIRITISAGEIITTNAETGYFQWYSGGRHLLILFDVSTQQHGVLAKHFRPLNTEDVFGDDIFIDYPLEQQDQNFINTWGYPPAAITDAMWLPHFYADILTRRERDALIEMCPRLRIRDDQGYPWYMNSVVNLRHGRAMFYNSAIMLGDSTHLAVQNIQRTDSGYKVNGVISTVDRRDFRGALLAESAFWQTYHRGDAVTFLLHLDGDYLDIYTEGTDIHVGTFIRVGREFQAQYQSLIRWNTSDLINVVWPQRADGTRHFTPPIFTGD